jgi:hypothetical protein
LPPDFLEAFGYGRTVIITMPEMSLDAMSGIMTAEEEPAIFPDYAIHGPHAGHLIAPSGRGGGYRNYLHSCRLQILKS